MRQFIYNPNSGNALYVLLFQLYTDYINDYSTTMEKFNECLQEETVFAKHVVMFEGKGGAVSQSSGWVYIDLRDVT